MTREDHAKGGRNRWKGTTKAERKKKMSETAKKRWAKHRRTAA